MNNIIIYYLNNKTFIIKLAIVVTIIECITLYFFWSILWANPFILALMLLPYSFYQRDIVTKPFLRYNNVRITAIGADKLRDTPLATLLLFTWIPIFGTMGEALYIYNLIVRIKNDIDNGKITLEKALEIITKPPYIL